ncbi:MAG: hypothetical protein FOGNACKC_00673 [Anaerolineae bacterium]|nr:hypothetical protein [Anaerolineae bacterium]
MSNQNESLDVSAKTVNEAIEQGLAQLGVAREQVDVEILSEGKRGIFGLGSEEALVRLTVRSVPPAPATEPPAPTAPAAPPPPPEPPAPAAAAPANWLDEADADDESDTGSSDADANELARGYLEHLLELMSIQAQVVVRLAPDLVENPGDPVPTVLDITGNDLGILIGRRSETLQALQYMVRLMVSKDKGSWQRVVLDVESYRSRRRKSLQKMAERMAERAMSSRERVVLEAMTPYERRIIHLTLRDHPKVYTKSIGRENNRKVTIIPK